MRRCVTGWSAVWMLAGTTPEYWFVLEFTTIGPDASLRHRPWCQLSTRVLVRLHGARGNRSGFSCQPSSAVSHR
eukprot:SAG11_NODE_4200_length_2019_cov_1.442708_3_plen_74_part_00